MAMNRLLVGGALGALGAIFVARARRVSDLGGRTAQLARAGRSRIKRAKDRDALEELPKEELYEQAKERDVPGRSTMTKDELIDALEDES
jgi:hypothetical protein